MDRVHRAGSDIGAAFKLAALAAEPRTSEGDAFAASTVAAQTAMMPQRGLLHRALRKLARYVFHVSRPLIKPVAYRLRRYLIEEIRTDMLALRQDVEHMSAAMRAQAEAHHQAQIEQSRHALAVAMMQAQAVREASSQRHEAVWSQLKLMQGEHDAVSRRLEEWMPAFAARLDRIETYGVASARRGALLLGERNLLIRTAVGYVLCDAADVALVAQLYETGELEIGTRMLIERLLQPGDTFIDVGANVGMHTLAAARAMQGQGRIFAFEPFARTGELLRESLWINGYSQMTKVHHAAVSSEAGRQALFLGGTSGHHSLFPLIGVAGAHGDAVDVDVVRLDDVIGPDEKVSLIKIDVEGAELDVLKGARCTIERSPSAGLIVEFGPSHLARQGHTVVQWLKAFSDMGFEYQVIDAQTGALETWPGDTLKQVDSVNLYFTRAGSAAAPSKRGNSSHV
jgi:FkbM family methyltransferase